MAAVRRTHRTSAALCVAALGLAAALAGCASSGSDAADASETIVTVESTTTMAPTTTAAPTTTTTIWPRTPAKPLPAAGAVPVLSRIDTTDPVVFLTIDDGAVRDPRVVDLLVSHHIPATLFVNEGTYLADPAYFAAAASGGGSINSHTRTHTLLTKLGESAQRNEVCGMRYILGQHMPNPGHLFRAPFGSSNATTQRVAGSCGINAILFWRAAINDGRVQYQQGDHLQPGDIVLSHFRPDLYEGLVALIAEAQRVGLTIAPIENYLPLPPA